jgi:putative sigma-54 modulation protein
MLNDSAVSTQVVLSKEKARVHAEITLHARGEHFLHSEGSGRDADAALGAAVDKVDRQVQRLKSRWSKGKRQGVSAAKAASATPERSGRVFGDGLRVVRARRYAVKPMSVDEAALEVADGSDAFLVFRNAATDTINVLFRRPDGNLGLIEPEA